MRRPYSTSFQVVSGQLVAAEAEALLAGSRHRWVVVEFQPAEAAPLHYFALRREEMFDFLRRLRKPGRDRPLWRSLKAARIWREAHIVPSGMTLRLRYAPSLRIIRLDAEHKPIAVADLGDPFDSFVDNELYKTVPVQKEPWEVENHINRYRLDLPTPPSDQDGTAPVRHPSISASAAPMPGQAIVITVDLCRQADHFTHGRALSIRAGSDAWTELPIDVSLASAGIDFGDGGRGTVLVRRNADSVAARFHGVVGIDLLEGETFDVQAQFWDGTRCAGTALRSFTVGMNAKADTHGIVRAPQDAPKPDLNVYIGVYDRSAPGKMQWELVTQPFDGLPAKLSGQIDVGQSPRDEANQMFREMAKQVPGEHTRLLEAFGERLWEKTPAEFKAAYWALYDYYGKPLSIQFTTDDPHLPWELMKPVRGMEPHAPLAQYHAVARWIKDYVGFMRSTLPGGRLAVVAPHYQSYSLMRPVTEEAAQALRRDYGATSIAGTREAMLDLLESPPAEPVALLYFTGHGAYDPNAPANSAIKLENGKQLLASEVRSSAVTLGVRHGTVVFFNACEVGATAAAFGEVGGWADAFLAREFRAFIAPLWAVEEKDAAIVSRELIDKLVNGRMTIGAALRDIRAKYGKTSPTFQSYLVYGDVNACFDTGSGSSTARP